VSNLKHLIWSYELWQARKEAQNDDYN